MLVLPIKKKWFDMIASGEKKEEYRDFKNYYHSRLLQYFSNKKDSDVELNCNEKPVIFRNDYNRNSPQIKCLCQLGLGYGKQEWGAEQGKVYYVLKILQVLGDEKQWQKQ